MSLSAVKRLFLHACVSHDLISLRAVDPGLGAE